jgi:hypothetical protein
MNIRISALGLAVAAMPWTGHAGGLASPAADAVWPRWQARLTLQTASPLSIDLAGRFGGVAPAGFQGGALLGDYYFARPRFGNFRASGGVMRGWQGGAPLLSRSAGPQLGLSVNQSGNGLVQPGADSPGTVTYLGLGYSSVFWHSSLSFTADVGMVAENPGAVWGVGRAIFGNQGLDSALHEVRLSRMVQLGVRYSF